MNDQRFELAGGLPENIHNSLQGVTSAFALGLPNDTCPKPPSNGLVPASSRSTSPDLDCHVTQPNLEAVVTWVDDRGRPRHTLDLAFGLHIDTSKRTALFSLHHHTSNPLRPIELPICLLIHPEQIVFIQLTTDGIQIPTSTGYTPNRFAKAFRLDLTLKRPPRLAAPTHERLPYTSFSTQRTFSSLREAMCLSVYFFTYDIHFRDRIIFLPSAILPVERRFQPKTPNTTDFSSQFFGMEGISIQIDSTDYTRPRSVSPDASPSSGYEPDKDTTPSPYTTTTRKRRRSWEPEEEEYSDDRQTVRRLASRIRALETKEVEANARREEADARIKYLEGQLLDIHKLLDDHALDPITFRWQRWQKRQ
ncbi:hypothetical protein B0T13DRAFT_88186 [Neurospora crassa]|nr:hypothetical protein B0T13DRAFT_88186 [Neurospora crassa]